MINMVYYFIAIGVIALTVTVYYITRKVKDMIQYGN
jgi:hypothetical protein